MNNNSEKEIFTSEELRQMNEKLKNTENLELPESLKAENIEAVLDNEKMWKPEEKKPVSKKSRKRKIYSFVAAAASFAIVFTSLMVAKPWEKEKEPPLNDAKPPVVNSVPQDYSIIEAKFSDYADKYESYQAKYKLYGALDDVVDGVVNFGTKNEAAMDMVVGSNTNTSAKPGTSVSVQNTTQKTESADHGETNEQVKGVSEADIIKNDGKYIYAVNPDNADWESYYDAVYGVVGIVKTTDENGNPVELEDATTEEPVLKYDCSISVIEPTADGKLKKIGNINIAQEDEKNIYHMVILEMYVKGDRLVALVECSVREDAEEKDDFEKQRYDYFGHSKSITMAVCFDISDRANAKEMWRVYQDGHYISSRLIDNQLVFLSNYYVNLNENKQDVINNCVPRYGSTNAPMQRIPCDCIILPENINDTSYLVASSLNIEDDSSLKTQSTLGAGSNVYCTTDTLYATSTSYKDTGVAEEVFGVTQATTSIYKFDIRNGDIKYIGCGSVKGSALNQFSIDEYNSYLRIATTTGNWGDELSNQVYVLDDSLKVVGEITGIAKGETIKSVRFTGDTGYVVTFEQTDPLFVIDLSNPQKPEIKGELKIPGFSAYLHPVSENLLLGVGVDGTNDGQGNGMKISLFDVSDPEKPFEADKIELSGLDTANRWTYIYSEAFYSHKAMCWDSDDAVMYIPYGKQDRIWAASNGEALSRTNTAGILAVKVNTESKKLLTDGNYICSSTDVQSSPDFSRVTYIGDVIMGFNPYSNGGSIYSFDKSTQMQTDVVYLRK